jgi:hypothetical protein
MIVVLYVKKSFLPEYFEEQDNRTYIITIFQEEFHNS